MPQKRLIKGFVYFAVIVILTPIHLVLGQTFRQGAPFIRNYSANEINMGSSEVFCWLQDNRGMVYIGNVTGITEFNGKEWRQIPNANNSIVRDMAIDSLGRVYVGASNDFGILQPDSLGNIKYQSLAKSVIDQKINFGDIWEIIPTSCGIYFCSNEYIFRYIEKKVSIIPVDFLVQDVYFVNNKLYLPTKTGTCLLEDTTLVPVSKKNSFWLTPFKGDKLLTITNKLQLGTIDISTFEISPFKSPVHEILKEEQPFEIDRIDENYFLVATLTDKIIILSNDGDIIQIIDRNNGLMDGVIYKVYVDKDKNLWVCMSKGIAKIDINYPVLKFGVDQNVTSNVLTSCFFDGIRYIGTLNGTYYLPPFDITRPDDNSKFIRMDINAMECWEFQVYNDQLYAICSEGVYAISGKKAKLFYDIESPDKGRCAGKSSRFPDILFVATKDRLLAIKSNLNNNKPKLVEQFELPDITQITCDKNGNLWMNTRYDGVYFLRFTDDDLKHCHVTLLGEHNGISLVKNTKTYNINDTIVITTNEGIFQPRFSYTETKPDSLIQFTYSTIFGDTIFDSQTRIISTTDSTYIICGNQIYFAKINGGKQAFDFKGFSRIPSGTTSLSKRGNWIISINSGNGLFDYYLSFDDRDYKKTFNTIINKVVQDDDSLLFGGYFSTILSDSTQILSFSQKPEQIPTISHLFNTITFHVSASFYENPELTEFQYQLEGFSKKWSNWSTDNKISYTRLPAGKYTFRAKALNVYGALSNVTEYKFVVATPWFQSWWAYSLYFLILCGIVYLLVTIFIHKLKKQKENLELVIEQRTKEIKEQALHLQEMNTKLIEIDKYKQDINNMIVHDLKNPINAIINLSDLNNNDDNGSWGIIQHAGLQMLNLVLNILDISKYEDTKLPVNIEQHNLLDISQKAIKQILFLSNNKNITIANNIIPQLSIKADYELTERIFVNMLTNAIKYSPNNSTIFIKSEILKERHDFIRITIRDQGIGIAEDKINLVFQKFGQVAEHNFGSVRSTGLGLAFCKMAVEAHEGEIGVDSELNKGSVFWFTLPASSSSISDFDNELTTTIRREEHNLSEQGKSLIPEILIQLQHTDYYKVSEILTILKCINDTNEELAKWKNNLIRAVNSGNEEKYNKLVNKH